MLKDIAGIRVCGANFENSSDILFLDSFVVIRFVEVMLFQESDGC